MRTSSETAGRPDRGLFGVVPPGRATDVAVAVLVAAVQKATIRASQAGP